MYEEKNKFNYAKNRSKVPQRAKNLHQMNWAVKNHLALTVTRVWVICSATQKSFSANPSVLDVLLYMVIKRQIISQCSPSKKLRAHSYCGVGSRLLLSRRDQKAGTEGGGGRARWAGGGQGRGPTYHCCGSHRWVGGGATHCRLHKVAHHAVSTCVGKSIHWATGCRTCVDQQAKEGSEQVSLGTMAFTSLCYRERN